MHHLCLFETSSFLRNKYSLVDNNPSDYTINARGFGEWGDEE